ncbi:hypothetical protein OS493_020232 [Desmophyllum pertusum]|uniref:Uncharacterized protein n=1 Tax=Desmophyllum pertusum TaxID=174260 RepID=A0A9W9ZPZ4_9CNID|nr:hypothetical protein OS493_020232 [Desmophyllum pertusum]
MNSPRPYVRRSDQGGTAPLDISLVFQPWDDSIAVRNLFLSTEGGKTKVPTHLSYDEWDCTALFQATIYARSFALPDSKGHQRTLGDFSEINKPTFDQYMQHAKDAFKALGVKTDPIDAIGGLTESDFPTEEVRKLEQGIKEETRAYIKFLEGVSADIDELRALTTAIKGKVEDTASKEDIAMLEQKIKDLLVKDEPGDNLILAL